MMTVTKLDSQQYMHSSEQGLSTAKDVNDPKELLRVSIVWWVSCNKHYDNKSDLKVNFSSRQFTLSGDELALMTL